MKKVTLTILSLLIAGVAFSEETQKKLVIGKILPGKEKVDPGKKRPVSDVTKPDRPEKKKFPPHWGRPPVIQTKDIRPLPAGFGMGSSTLAHWITSNIKKDLKDKPRPQRPEPSEEVKEKLKAVRIVQLDLAEKRKALLDSLKSASKEDRKSLIEKFRTDNKERHQELKAKQKELVRTVRERVQTGARRE